ncbi:MAG: hypothetical protein GY847_14330 [Proteobacteria bacterium]|nr:hypothetical protein [Pseudomonadota bacterium]
METFEEKLRDRLMQKMLDDGYRYIDDEVVDGVLNQLFDKLIDMALDLV